MHRIHLLFFVVPFVASAYAQETFSPAEQRALLHLEQRADHYNAIADQIWRWAELGYQENKSSDLLRIELADNGFTVETGVAEIPTAFVATYGQGRPVIAILGEFDALPGVSQAAVPYPLKREASANGHACGHHLFGTASAAATIAVKDWLERTGQTGTIRFYGTPAEEGGAGKVYMTRAGLFDDVDAVLHWHPSDNNSADAGSTLSNMSAKFRFYGQAAHAAAAPERGRSALDGVEAMNYMTNLMREHVSEPTRIHYVITRGGEAPNVVPAFAEVFYYVRHPDRAEVKRLFQRLVLAAEGAALGTETRMEYEIIHGSYNLLPNRTLAEVMHANLVRVGGVVYDDRDRAFADSIFPSLQRPDALIAAAAEVKPFVVSEKVHPASTDVGDVSWVAPTAGLRTATWVPGTPAHSWQAVACGGTGIGHKGMLVAAKTLSLTAMRLILEPELNTAARAELRERTGADFRYEALLGERKPPLDYRE